MYPKTHFSKALLWAFLFPLLLATACEPIGKETQVATLEVHEITWRSAMVEAEVTAADDANIVHRGLLWGRTPDLSMDQREDTMRLGSGPGAFSGRMAWLMPESDYHVRAYALEPKGYVYGEELTFRTLTPDYETGSVTDIDNNTYATVVIGEQEWMTENLKVTRYANGTPIPYVSENEDWKNLGTNDKAYTWADPDTQGHYGALYTWGAATNGQASEANPSGVQGVCPDGWHLPSRAEWLALRDYIGLRPGDALKATHGWGDQERHNGFDVFGFNGLPGGYRNSLSGAYQQSPRFSGSWWSATDLSGGRAHGFTLHAFQQFIMPEQSPRPMGYAVRCVKN